MVDLDKFDFIAVSLVKLCRLWSSCKARYIAFEIDMVLDEQKILLRVFLLSIT